MFEGWSLAIGGELSVCEYDDDEDTGEKVVFRAEEAIDVRQSIVSIFGREGHWIPPSIRHFIRMPPFSLRRWDRLQLYTCAGTNGIELRKRTRITTIHLGLPKPIRRLGFACGILFLCDWSTAAGPQLKAEFHF